MSWLHDRKFTCIHQSSSLVALVYCLMITCTFFLWVSCCLYCSLATGCAAHGMYCLTEASMHCKFSDDPNVQSCMYVTCGFTAFGLCGWANMQRHTSHAAAGIRSVFLTLTHLQAAPPPPRLLLGSDPHCHCASPAGCKSKWRSRPSQQ